MTPTHVYLVTSGDGSDGDEWQVHSIQPTESAAREWIFAHNAHRHPWGELRIESIEAWPLGIPFDPADC